MDEQEWLECKDPQKMLDFLKGRASERKLRLFACACARHVWHYPLEEMDAPGSFWIAGIRDAVRVGERLADGQATREELEATKALDSCGVEILYAFLGCSGPVEELSEVAQMAIHGVWEYAFSEASQNPSLRPAQYSPVAVAAQETERAAQSHLLRDVFGPLLFRTVTIPPTLLTWGDFTIPRLAQSAYENRQLPSGHLDPALLAVLADALEEAGCTDAEVLGHLRSPGPHVRGCWVVDSCLGKS